MTNFPRMSNLPAVLKNIQTRLYTLERRASIPPYVPPPTVALRYSISSFSVTAVNTWQKATGWSAVAGNTSGVTYASGTFTVVSDGWYQLSVWAQYTTLASATRRILAVFEGGTAGTGTEIDRAEVTSSLYFGANLSPLWYFEAGDTFNVALFSGATTSLGPLRIGIVKVG